MRGLEAKEGFGPRGFWQVFEIEGRVKARMLREEWTQQTRLCGK